MVAVGLSVAVMIVTTAVVTGFQQEISRKIFGFWGHIHISRYDLNELYEDVNPIAAHEDLYRKLDSLPGVHHIQAVANKAGIAKTDTDIEGLMLKGVGEDFDWQFLNEFIAVGKPLTFADSTTSNDILISQTTANRLRLKVGDGLAVYFVQNPPRVRKFTISGIYNTGLAEYDEKYALVDIRHIRKLNDWGDDQVGGFEVFLNDINDLDSLSEQVYATIDSDMTSRNMKEINPNIFEWIALQSMNERVILIIMISVAIINMITTLLILILERTNMVGIFKALGARNWTIQQVFLYNAAYIVCGGLLLGNTLGLLICILQQQFKFIRLPEESYYLNFAPIELNGWFILAINVGTLVICVVSLILPSYLITRISPIKAIRFK